MQFNSELMKLARQSRRITQKELSSRLNLKQSHVSKIEHGIISPSDEIISKLSHLLEYPMSFFFQNERTVGLPLSVHPQMYRKKASVTTKDLDFVNAKLNILMLNIKKLLNSVNFKPVYDVPNIDPEEYNYDIEKIAEIVRRTWLIPSGPIKNLTELVESTGIIIIPCNFGGVKIDGISLFRHDIGHFIFVNEQQTADRMRLTIGHELGHLILHRLPSPEMEEEANLFASSFLMPRNDIRHQFGSKVDLKSLAQMKSIWKMSMQAIAMRAKAIDVITKEQSNYIWRSFQKAGLRTREPASLDFPYDEPTIISRMINVHIEQLEYSTPELARVLHLNEKYFRKQFLGQHKEKSRTKLTLL